MASPPSPSDNSPRGGFNATDGGDAICNPRPSASPEVESISSTEHAQPAVAIVASKITQLPLYPWQEEVLGWFDTGTAGPRGRVKGALCTPNGAGKSERVVASLALWWLAAHPRGKVVITTRDSKQLDNQVFPALRRHESKFPDWRFVSRHITTPTGGRCVLFTTDEPGRAEGWHKEDDVDGPLLIIVDEAKSVPDLIFQAIDRCTYNALLYVSSPGVKTGRFYDVFAKDLGFHAMQVGLKDCPHIPKARIDDIVRTYGGDHPFTLSTLHGEFMDEDGETMFVVGPAAVRQLYECPPEFVDGRQYAFCDFAAGGDENVLAHRVGNRILPLLAWKEANTMASVGRFIIEFEKRGLRAGDIYGDEGGLGGPMIDRLAEAGWPINRVNNGAQALNPGRYENRGAEMWHGAGEVIAGYGIILPPDDRLKAQLTTRKIKLLSDGRLGVESKKDMAARGLNSPDRGDAVVGVIAIDAEILAGEFDQDGVRRLEKMVKEGKSGALTAADFGVNFRAEGGGLRAEGGVERAWLEVWELPTYGRAYLATLKAGEEGWSVFILRRACTDEQGREMNAACVCRINPESLRGWDAALLADRVELLLRWYGNPVIVPDVRNGMDILERLKEKGVSIYRRPVSSSTSPGANHGATTSQLGWETTEKNIAVAVSTLARAIREQSVDIWSESAVRDIRRFTRRNHLDNGDTLALGIGLQCLEAATVHTAPPLALPQAMWGVTMLDDRAGGLAGAGACR